MYDPTLGRFLQRDPLGPALLAPTSYSYADDRPTYFLDPSGLITFSTDEEHCTITMNFTIRIGDWARNPRTGGDWTAARKRQFMNRLKSSIESWWNTGVVRIYSNRSILLGLAPPPAGSGFCGAVGSLASLPPPGRCLCDREGWLPQVNVQVVEGANPAVDNTMTAQSGGAVGGVRANVSADRRTSTLNEDSVEQTGVVVEQRSRPASAHEFGHMIGLPHPGAFLTPNDPNSEASYNHDRSALMGRGAQLRASYFQAWADELDRELPDCAPHRARQVRSYRP